MPGGCAIGDRPIDLHLLGLRQLGAQIHLKSGYVIAEAPEGLKGASIFLGGPFGSTVLGTANVMMAATLAKGRTIIESAACEPEITDLANCLNAMGARISGIGSPRLIIDGVNHLHPVQYRVIPDRIEAGTFMAAAAITGGEVHIGHCRLDDMMAVVDRLRIIGITVEPNGDGCTVAGAEQLPARRHHDPALPRLPDRPAGPVHGPAGPGRRQQRRRREDLPRPVPARGGAQPHGGQPPQGRLGRDRRRGQEADRGPRDGLGPAGLGRPGRGRPGRRRDHDDQPRLPHRPRLRADRRAAQRASAPRSAAKKAEPSDRRTA